MRIFSLVVASCIAGLVPSASHATPPVPEERLRPTPLPSLEERVRDAELIVRVSIETKHRVIVYRVLEILKGTYQPRDYGDQYKGYFTDYTLASEYREKHKEEFWILGKSEVIYAPDKRQDNPIAITGYATKYYRVQLHLPVKSGIITFPTVERPYRNEVLETKSYKRNEFIALIHSATKGSSEH